MEEVESEGEGFNLDQAFYDRLSKKMGERLRECGSRVPVVTGTFLRSAFVGQSTETDTLFRSLQVTSASFPVRSSSRSVEAIPISVLPFAPSAWPRPSCRSGRRSTEFSRPTLERSRPPASSLASRPTRLPS